MKKLLVLLICLIIATPVLADPKEEVVKAKDELRKTFPRLNIDGIYETPIPELYEIVAGNQIFYFSPKGYLIFGEIWSKDGYSLTAKRFEEIVSARVKEIPLEKALKIGSGKNVVIEFTDPDCPFCRKAHEYLSKRDDLTRYVFFFPLTQIHPHSKIKTKYILCSDDPEKAFEEVYSGKLDNTQLTIPETCKKDDVIDEYLNIGMKVGVTGTPAFFINGKFVNGANIPLIEQLLAKGE